MNETLLSGQPARKNLLIFVSLWLVTLALYLSAATAGWVIDAAGFLYNLRHESFGDFINRAHSDDQSFYQVLTLQYYIGYKLWGMNPYAWSLLYITLQAANAYLLFLLGSKLFADSGADKGFLISLLGAVLFTVCPHISEVVICKAYYHYLQSFLFILLIMLWTMKYQHEQQSKYVWWSFALFLVSAFTLEIFYIIPFFVVSIALYYRFALGYDAGVCRKTIVKIAGPQLALLAIYFVAQLLVYKNLHVHKIGGGESALSYLAKVPKYLFHIIFLGRFFDTADKRSIYSVLDSAAVVILFYALVLAGIGYGIARLNRLAATTKVLSLLFVWALMALAFVTPLSFPDYSLLIFYDRYTYFANGFVFMVIVAMILKLKNKNIAYGMLVIYAGLNIYFTITVNDYWRRSDKVNTALLNNLPETGDKKILMLNLPENMNGAPMIGAQKESEYKVMREVYTGVPLQKDVREVISYNMTTDTDGVHVTVVNDSTLDVALNQWGSWWWYEGHGAKNYQAEDYSVTMIDKGRAYRLVLKRPASDYALLYETGDKWNVVNMRPGK